MRRRPYAAGSGEARGLLGAAGRVKKPKAARPSDCLSRAACRIPCRYVRADNDRATMRISHKARGLSRALPFAAGRLLYIRAQAHYTGHGSVLTVEAVTK